MPSRSENVYTGHMSKTINSATFEDLSIGRAADIVEIANILRNLIIKLHPETVEVVYPGYNSSNFGVGPKKNSEGYAYIMFHKKHVNLGFYFGVDLPDPRNLLEGTGKKLRHIKIKSIEQTADPAIRELLQEAISERKAAFNL